MMRRILIAGTISLSVLSWTTDVRAGVYTDDLAKCMVKGSSEEDLNTLMQWLFAAMSVNPAIKSMTNVTAAQRETYSRSGATLLERLVLKDCHAEAVSAFKYEGAHALEGSFQILGGVAGRGLMSAPSTAAELQRFAKFLDEDKWKALGREAGITQPEAPAKPTPKS
jgi:hypothetical protein